LPTDFLLIPYVFSFKIKDLGRTGQPTGEDGRRDGASKIEERQQRRGECSAEGVEMGSTNVKNNFSAPKAPKNKNSAPKAPQK